MKTFERLDSCRSCGSDLEVKTVCAICDQPEQVRCASCYHYVDDPVHTECAVLERETL